MSAPPPFEWTWRKKLVCFLLISLLLSIAVTVRVGQWACRLFEHK
jgi:hypothetical protein